MRNGSRPSAPRADTQHVPVDHHRTIESAARDDRPGRSIARRRSLVVVAVLALLAIFATSCESTEADMAEVLALVNQSRRAAGLRPLARNTTLNGKADAWAAHLRDICGLEHSRLADGAPPEWQKLGENVGHGGTIALIHDAYMNSPGHRRNILDASFTSMGAGAVYGTCNGERRVFTVQVFMR